MLKSFNPEIDYNRFGSKTYLTGKVILVALLPALLLPLVDFNLKLLFALFFCIPIIVVVSITMPLAIAKLNRLWSELRWWHILWLIALVSGLSFRLRDADSIQENLLDFWAIYRISLVGIIAIGLFINLTVVKSAWLINGTKGLVLYLLIYALISVASSIWSVYPLWTLYKSSEYLVDVLLLIAIVGSAENLYKFKTLFDWHWMLYGIQIIWIFVAAVIWPSDAVKFNVGTIGIQLQGVFPTISTSGVGFIGASIAIVGLTRLILTHQKRFYSIISLIAFILMIMAQSRSALSAFMVAALVIVFIIRPPKFLFWLLIFSIPVVGIMVLANFHTIFVNYFLRGQDQEQLMSLTGRTYLWQLTWGYISQQPWVGYGAFALTRFIVAEARGYLYSDTIVSGVDNAFIEVLSGVGINGLLPLLLSIIGTSTILVRTTHRNFDPLGYSLAVEAIGIMILLLTTAFFTSGSFIWHPPLSFLMCLGYAEFLRTRYNRDESIELSSP